MDSSLWQRLMWLYLAPLIHHGHLRRALALGRLAPEPVVVLSGSEFAHDAPNCHVQPYSEAAFRLLAPAASRIIFDVKALPYDRRPGQKVIFVQRTPNRLIEKPDADVFLTAGLYEKTQWPGLITEAWINPPGPIMPTHDVVVVASGPVTILPWYIRITRALLAAGVDAFLVAPTEVDEVPSAVSVNAPDWIASANVVVATSGITMYEALYLDKRFLGIGMYPEQLVRLEGAIAGGEAVRSVWEPRDVMAELELIREQTPRPHRNGAPAAVKVIS